MSSIQTEKTVGEIVREYFPKADDKQVEAILYGKTAFPCFWRAGDIEAQLRSSLSKYARAVQLGRDVCYCCGKIRFKSQMPDGTMCKRGLQILRGGKADARP